MNDNKESAIDRFLQNSEPTSPEIHVDRKKKVLDEREGLIERIDKVLVTKDGKQLLREQY